MGDHLKLGSDMCWGVRGEVCMMGGGLKGMWGSEEGRGFVEDGTEPLLS